MAIDRNAKQYQIGNVAIGGGLEVKAHAGLARWGDVLVKPRTAAEYSVAGQPRAQETSECYCIVGV
jgi:hypothetical protein